jgi:hypothetical protein
LRGLGVVNMDLAVSRDFPIKDVSNMVLNPDGSVKNLAGYSQIMSTQNLGRDFDDRHLQFDLRISF